MPLSGTLRGKSYYYRDMPKYIRALRRRKPTGWLNWHWNTNRAPKTMKRRDMAAYKRMVSHRRLL